MPSACVVVTTTLTGSSPPDANCDGVTLQAAPTGAPSQASTTVPTKLFNVLAFRLKSAVFPAATVTTVVPLSAGWKRMSAGGPERPVPARATDWGLAAALSATVSAPERAPEAAGVNVT